MRGSMIFGENTFPFEDMSRAFEALMSGEVPTGTRTFKKDIVDSNGKKVGTEVIRTYSSGRSNAPSNLVCSQFPPCNIGTDKQKRKFYEFSIAGYDPDNVTFKVNEDNPSYINLVLKSGMTEVEPDEKSEDAASEEVKTEEDVVVYDYQKVIIKDHTCPFYVDRDRYDIEKSEVTFKNGMVRISFEPKKVAFKPKIVK